MPFQTNPQFAAHVQQALQYHAAGDHTRFEMFCRGLKSLYRRQRMIFVVEDTGRHVSFALLRPITKLTIARYMHIDTDKPPIRIVLPPKDFNQRSER
jgi:hypothetical protein